MTHFGYIVAGYGLTAAILGGYAWWIRVRSRALAADAGHGAGGGVAGPESQTGGA